MLILQSYDYVLFDGAFGTYYSKKYHSEQPCELACIEYPERVLEIHQEYIEAGAMAIKTNTFAANTISLKKDFSSVREIITQAWKLANQAIANQKVFVFADIGPIFTRMTLLMNFIKLRICFCLWEQIIFCWKPHKMTLYFVWPDILSKNIRTHLSLRHLRWTKTAIPEKEFHSKSWQRRVKIGI